MIEFGMPNYHEIAMKRYNELHSLKNDLHIKRDKTNNKNIYKHYTIQIEQVMDLIALHEQLFNIKPSSSKYLQ